MIFVCIAVIGPENRAVDITITVLDEHNVMAENDVCRYNNDTVLLMIFAQLMHVQL